MQNEVWWELPFTDEYLISSLGRLRRNKPNAQGRDDGRVLKPFTNDSGYLVQTFRVDGKFTKIAAHRLVCIAFHGPPPSSAHQAAHRDGDKLNNCPENIYWATVKENAEDRVAHGTQVRGARHWSRLTPEKVRRGDRHFTKLKPERVRRGERVHNSALTDEQAREILRAPHYHGAGRDLAKRYGVSRDVICNLRRGRCYAHVKI